ncbi:MAG TPA: M48 family metallopeptidase [Mycobacteriales bacterium]|nr:M48 family metallopeptidase [Mycobacteriales bacterium]
MYEQIASNKRRAVFYIGVFIVVWAGVGAALGALIGSFSRSTTTDEFGNSVATGPAHTSAGLVAGVVIAVVIAVLATMYTLQSGHKLVLAVSGAKPADPTQYLQLHNIVETLAIGDGLPKPDVYVIDDPSPNAFATGVSPQKAAITATTGLLQTMDREELEGVIGHEMSHIKNYDVRLILVVSTLIGMAGLVASLIWRIGFYTRERGRNAAQIMIVVFAAGILFGIVAFIVGPLIKLALSRRRESLADVSGVELTRNPAGLIRALQKLQANDQPFAKFNHATAAMCIDDPLQHHASFVHRLFDTHPPIADRIAALQRIANVQEL